MPMLPARQKITAVLTPGIPELRAKVIWLKGNEVMLSALL